MTINNKEKKHYRAIGHKLKPLVIISKGMSENIEADISRALADHELIKIKLNVPDRSEKKKLAEKICTSNNAELIQLIGNIALILKAAKKPNPKLSNLVRHKNLI